MANPTRKQAIDETINVSQVDGEIKDLEELQNICVLGLSIWLADPTKEQAIVWANPVIKQSQHGLLINSGKTKGLYVQWSGIHDPSFVGTPYNDDLKFFDNEQAAWDHVNKILFERRKKKQ